VGIAHDVATPRGIAKGCRTNLAGAEGLKLPSPNLPTVRAATAGVKGYRNGTRLSQCPGKSDVRRRSV